MNEYSCPSAIWSSRAASSGGEQEAVLALRKEYRGIIADLKSRAEDDEQRRLINGIEQATAPWRDADDRVMKFSGAGQTAAASNTYRNEALPCFDGVLRAVDAVLKYHEKRVEEINRSGKVLIARLSLAIWVIGLLLLACTAGFTTLITHSIANPLQKAVAHLNEVALGDLTRDAAESESRGDEIGLLVNAKQLMITNLRRMVQEIRGGVEVLSSSSEALSANSCLMSEGGRHAADKAHTVAAAAEEMTSNVVSVAAGMEQTSNNLISVATATEQMTATIGEIAGNSEKARRITEEATRQAVRISEQMGQPRPGRASHR